MNHHPMKKDPRDSNSFLALAVVVLLASPLPAIFALARGDDLFKPVVLGILFLVWAVSEIHDCLFEPQPKEGDALSKAQVLSTLATIVACALILLHTAFSKPTAPIVIVEFALLASNIAWLVNSWRK